MCEVAISRGEAWKNNGTSYSTAQETINHAMEDMTQTNFHIFANLSLTFPGLKWASRCYALFGTFQ
ncbi:AGAP012162-PA [Anopheles gambiae str. PEST]|uniref:AGAP012162-PA n=1 Tax=Anopheles gambiae TaxID=7165 RepID=A0NGI0_ANOGA|nr:AGAP012162-PA [Anopheles gambiae str. PEST]